jgi:hypothetical protein
MEVTKRYDLEIRRCLETENLEIDVNYEHCTLEDRVDLLWLHIIEKKDKKRRFCDRSIPNNCHDDKMYGFIEPTYDDEWVAAAVTPELRALIFKLIDEVEEEAKRLIPAFKGLL